MKFNDEVIAHIAKILQMALITGTDIVDHLRMVTLDEKEGTLFLDDDYVQNNDENIQKMIEDAVANQSAGEMQ
tara:strand:- start:1031 stop:1249 length:219 start_codon:yes stop_codon:yes gene_type:complete